MWSPEIREVPVTQEQKKIILQEIIDHWVNHLESLRLSEVGQSVMNKERFAKVLVEAALTEKPVQLIALGCQNWITPKGGTPLVDYVIGRMDGNNKRVQRFIREVKSFSNSLTSFRVPHVIHFSLSDLEVLLHTHLKNFGVKIHNDDALEVSRFNLDYVVNELQKHDLPVQQFSHSEVLAHLLSVSSLQDLQQIVLNGGIGYRAFLDNLYKLDLTKVASHFITKDLDTPVWLNIQSLNYRDEVVSMLDATRKAAPDLPMLTLFPNAGNLQASQVPQRSFPTKEDVVAQMVQLKNTPTSVPEWTKKLHKTSDTQLVEVLKKFGCEVESITSGPEKTLAVRVFFQAVFGFDPFDATQKEREL